MDGKLFRFNLREYAIKVLNCHLIIIDKYQSISVCTIIIDVQITRIRKKKMIVQSYSGNINVPIIDRYSDGGIL